MLIDALVGHIWPLLTPQNSQTAIDAHLCHVDNGFLGLRGAVGAYDDILGVQKGAVRLRRFFIKYIQTGSGDHTAV